MDGRRLKVARHAWNSPTIMVLTEASILEYNECRNILGIQKQVLGIEIHRERGIHKTLEPDKQDRLKTKRMKSSLLLVY